MIYLAHPRTASVSTAWMLCNQAGFEKVGIDHHTRLWGRTKAAIPLTKENRGEWIVFTAVRNHWDAAVSWRFHRAYMRKNKEPWGSELWRLLFSSINWIKHAKLWSLHSDDADVVLRFESLEDDLRNVLSERSLGFWSLPHDNMTPGRNGEPYHDFFTESGRDYIAKRFAGEIERFGYVF